MLPQQVRYHDVEVRPEAIQILLEAFRLFPSIGQRYLVKHGVIPPAPQTPAPGRYIPLTAWLGAFHEILSDVGPSALFRVGQLIIKNPHIPVDKREMMDVLRAIDVGFHQSHFKQRKPMYDDATKQFVEGIGHFAVERGADPKSAIITCDTPYPCPLEHGIISGVATTADPRASVSHHDPSVCRLKGAERCRYLVRW